MARSWPLAGMGLLFILAGCAPLADQTRAEMHLAGIPVASCEPLDPQPFKRQLANYPHPDNLLPAIIAQLGISTGQRELLISYEHFPTENPTTAIITVRRDGFLDDSVRGDLHVIELRKDFEGEWTIFQACRARLCWRAEKLVFHSGVCP